MSFFSDLHSKFIMTNRPSVILPLPPSVICSASETDTLIEFHRNVLNEVKNRIVTKGKPSAEILHFVQNDKICKDAFSFVIFACLMPSLGSTNNKQKETSPCPPPLLTTPAPPEEGNRRGIKGELCLSFSPVCRKSNHLKWVFFYLYFSFFD